MDADVDNLNERVSSSLNVSEGFLAEDHPTAPPVATRAGLSSFAAARLAADPKDTEHAIRPDSPRSEDSAPHASDNEFIDDAEHDHDEDFSMYYRVDTRPDL